MSAPAGADLTIRNGVVVTPTGLVRGGLSVDRRCDHAGGGRPPAADGGHRGRRGRQVPAAGDHRPARAPRDRSGRGFREAGARLRVGVGRRRGGRRHHHDHDNPLRHRVTWRGGRGRDRHRQPALAGGLPPDRGGHHPRAPDRGRGPGQARAPVVQVLPRLQGRTGRGLRHERRRDLVGLLLPGLRGAGGGGRQGVPDRPRRGPVGAGLPHRAAARVRAERAAAALAGDQPEHPRADADLPGRVDRARGRHAGLRGAHQRLAERRADPRPQGQGLAGLRGDPGRVPVLDRAGGRRPRQGCGRQDPAADPAGPRPGRALDRRPERHADQHRHRLPDVPAQLPHRRRLLGRAGRAGSRAWAPRSPPCTPRGC